MKRLKGLPKGRTLTMPVMGAADYNSGFFLAIGQLVTLWANNESVFLAMLQVLMPDVGLTPSIVWYSLRTSAARRDLLSKLLRERVTDADLVKEIEAAIVAFRGPTTARNFYCHATYRYDDQKRLESVQGVTLSQEGVPIRFTTKKIGAAVANEIGNAIVDLAQLNGRLWNLVDRLADTLGVRRVERQPSSPESPPP